MIDPPVREDGRCARHGCGKALQWSKVAARYAGAHLELDPFCSRTCCEVYHGTGEEPSERQVKSAMAGMINADRYRASRAEKARY